MDRRRYYWLMSVVVVALGVFGTYEFFKAKSYKQSHEDSYIRAFFELTRDVDDIDTLLAKGMLATSAGEMATISQELSVQAAAAKSCLAQLPITEVRLDKTEKFLSQVGDFTYLLSQEVISDNEISDKEYKTLSDLSSYATKLNDNLLAMQQDIYDGNISFGTIREK